MLGAPRPHSAAARVAHGPWPLGGQQRGTSERRRKHSRRPRTSTVCILYWSGQLALARTLAWEDARMNCTESPPKTLIPETCLLACGC